MSASKTALLIVAHGSTLPKSNQEVQRLVDEVRKISKDHFLHVDLGFLELADPKISQSIDNLVEKGATTIKIFPYFLAAGSHVSADVPAIIKKKQDQFDGQGGGIKIELLDHLGIAKDMPDFLVKQVIKIS